MGKNIAWLSLEVATDLEEETGLHVYYVIECQRLYFDRRIVLERFDKKFVKSVGYYILLC